MTEQGRFSAAVQPAWFPSGELTPHLQSSVALVHYFSMEFKEFKSTQAEACAT
jgi:hypothetical protein